MKIMDVLKGPVNELWPECIAKLIKELLKYKYILKIKLFQSLQDFATVLGFFAKFKKNLKSVCGNNFEIFALMYDGKGDFLLLVL